MSVTDWDSVKPENAFLCASLYSDKIELGFAKQISKMYLGLFYYGDFFTGTNSTYDSVTQETTKQLRGFNRLHILFGIKNWGIQLGYASKSDDDTFIYDNAAPNTLTKQIDSRSWYEFSLDAGTKFSQNDILFKPYTKVLYGVINSFWDRTTDPETLTELNSKLYYENGDEYFYNRKTNYLIFDLGSEILLKQKNIVQNSFDLYSRMEYDFYPKYIEHVKDGNDVTNDSIDYSRFVLLFTPAYILQVTPNNKVCIKTKFSTPIQLFSSNNGDRVSYKNGAESSRIPYDVKETDLLANLKTEIAIQYKPIPDKLNINLACSVTSPTFNKIKVVDNKVTTTNTLSFQGFASSVNVGFSYTFAKILMLDCNWNILQIDADSLNSTLDAIWNKSIYIGLSAKF